MRPVGPGAAAAGAAAAGPGAQPRLAAEATRDAVPGAGSALDVVDEVYFESRREAYDRFRELHRAKPELVERTRPAALPESFRVTLEDPVRIDAFHRALCPSKRTGDCGEGIVVVRHPRR
jgi:FtsX extracellular domain